MVARAFHSHDLGETADVLRDFIGHHEVSQKISNLRHNVTKTFNLSLSHFEEAMVSGLFPACNELNSCCAVCSRGIPETDRIWPAIAFDIAVKELFWLHLLQDIIAPPYRSA